MCDPIKVAGRALLLSVAVLGLAAAPLVAETPKAAAVGEPAIITAIVPADAEVWVGDQKMTTRGTQRRYTTPALPNDDKTYVYDFRVRWTEEGKTVERTRQIFFRPGDHVSIAFRTNQDQAAYRANLSQRTRTSAYPPSGAVGGTGLAPGAVAPAYNGNNNTTTIIPSVGQTTTNVPGTVVTPGVGVIGGTIIPGFGPLPTPPGANQSNPANPGTPPGFQPQSGTGNVPSNTAAPLPTPQNPGQPAGFNPPGFNPPQGIRNFPGPATNPNQMNGTPQGTNPTAQPAGPASNPNQANGTPQGTSPTAQPPGPASPPPVR